MNENSSQSKLKVKDVKILINFQNSKEKKTIQHSKTINRLSKKKSNIIESNIIYNDFELNSFTYNEALSYDRRTYSEYYISLLKRKNPIIFSFVPYKDYNTMIIKICLFFLSFSLYYVMNAFFFDEVTIHQIYEDGGEYNLSFFLLPIFLSFIFAHILSTIIKYIFLSERNIYEVKKVTELMNAREIGDKVKRKIIIKYITFFTISIIFIIFFWYYLSSFGAVYRNTQVFLIKNTFISCFISLVYPFIINLLPGILRMNSLKDENKNKEFMFKVSKILQYI